MSKPTTQKFATAREAKEFLVSRIVAEAQREAVSLSEIERKMLYFSEAGWTLPDIIEVNEAFDREYDQTQYEQKIGKLSQTFCAKARKDDSDELRAWKEALRTLSQEDHYIFVLTSASSGPTTTSSSRFLKLAAIAIALACTFLAIIFFFVK